MIKDSSKDKFSIVLVYSFDRFARSRYDSATYKSKLKKNGAKVVSATEMINDDPSGILMESVLEGMAEYYSASLSKNVKRGLQENIKKCKVIGPLPIGYKSVDKKYAIDDVTAPIIRKIFDMYLDDEKMIDIADYLNGLGYVTKKGSQFKTSSISKILHNKRYAGYYIVSGNEVEGGIPAIISEEQYIETLNKMSKNKSRSSMSKAKGEQYLLTTKLYCGICDSPMSGTSGYGKLKKLYQYYGCTNRINIIENKCTKKNISKSQIENKVVDLCFKQLTNDNIEKIANEVMAICESEKDTSHIRTLEKTLDKLTNQKKNLINSLKLGSDNESFQEMIYEQFETIGKQEAEVQKDIWKETSLQNTLTKEHILFFLNDLKNGDIKDYKYRKLIVDVFINKIYLFDDKIKIVFTTQLEKVDVNQEILMDLEGSVLNPSGVPEVLELLECI